MDESGRAGLSSTGSVDLRPDVLATGRVAELGGIMHAKPGDWLIVETATVDRHSIRARIDEVLSGDGQPPYRVRWTTDDHVSVVFPGPDARVVTTEELAVMDHQQAKRFSRRPDG